MKQLMMAIREFDFTDNTRSSVPSLATWLQSLHLDKIRPKLELLGVVELADLSDMDDRELASLQLNKLQLKVFSSILPFFSSGSAHFIFDPQNFQHWNLGMLQVMAAQRQSVLDGKNDDPTFRTWLESWRLTRLQPFMEAIGAYTRQDLLDLEPTEYHMLQMKSLEAKRFEQAMIQIEEEFAEKKVFSSTKG